MKASLAALVAVAAPLVAAHYTFPNFISNGATSADWEFIRITQNHYSNGPVTDVTSPEFRCYELDMQASPGQTSTQTVSAGSTVGFQANGPIYHPGYLSVYMTKADPAADAVAAGTAKTWFKVYEQSPTFENGQLVFPSTTQQSFEFTLPKSLPSGQYLARVEQIGLHVASSFQGAQFYIGCAQINVVDGGAGSPAPLVAIPGVYTGYEPGILINIYNLPSNFTGYQAPGPAVWHG